MVDINRILGDMEKILRNIASGFVALIVIQILYPNFTYFNKEYALYTILIAAPLLGLMIYSLHACFFYQIIATINIYVYLLWIRIWKTYTREQKIPCDTHAKLFKHKCSLDIQRWKRRASEKREIRNFQKELDKWYALIHYLFCSSYVMITVPIILKLETKMCIIQKHYCSISSMIGWVVFAIAFITDFRAVTKEFWATQAYPDGCINV